VTTPAGTTARQPRVLVSERQINKEIQP